MISVIAGVDEAGRGPLCGDVYAAAVVLDPCYAISGLADSKALTERKREALAAEIKQHALAWAICSASPDDIAQLNILHATMAAMTRAVADLALPNGFVLSEILIDGNRVPLNLPVSARAIVQGDVTEAAISAASILAKTARDESMRALDLHYPQYGFAQHKGYGTAQHLAAIRAYGVLPEHRRDFAPIREILTQDSLF